MPWGGIVGTFSPALALLPGAAALLGVERVESAPALSRAEPLSGIVSWAHDENEGWSKEFAERAGLPWLRVAPGFLFRVGVRGAAEPPISLLVDDHHGAHDDARSASRLERLIADAADLSEAEAARARAAMARVVAGRFSGSSCAVATSKPQTTEPYVLVVDPWLDAAGCARLQAPYDAFERMLEAALREHPDARVYVYQPQGPTAATTQGRDARVEYVTGARNAFELLEGATDVYVAGSEVGFEALLAGKRVSCFGVPWYAGWGLTDDRVPMPARRTQRSLEALFHAAYIAYPRYADPESGAPWQLEQALSCLERQHALFALNRGHIYCHGFTLWKRNIVRAYLRSPGNRITFIASAAQARRRGFDADSKLLVWGTREEPEVGELAKRHNVPIWRMEDGFLRSVGLGADLTVPASLVVDREGIYFDPTAPSELESILQHAAFSADELARARALRELIVQSAISKYNVGDASKRLSRPEGVARVLLVPGQVEDDASIRRGCRDLRTNAGLLEAVRAQNPDAYIIFKPHPDVTDARREGAVPEDLARKYADQVLLGVPLPACLAIADEVHTLTSLVGFEALLRGLKVFAYGQPFYAGWGLTSDRHPVERRTRRLSLDELVAGVLLRYPRYLGPRSRLFTTPEVVVQQLRAQMLAKPAQPAASRLRRELRRARHVIEGLLDVP